MKKRMLLVTVLIVAMIFVTACGNTGQRSDEKSTRIFTDLLGRKVTIPEEVKTVAVSGPLAQMMVFALAPDMLVGLSSKLTDKDKEFYPQEYWDLPEIGQLYVTKGEFNQETLIEVNPDLIIDMGEPKGNVKGDLDELQEDVGIPVIQISTYIDTYGDAFRLLGDILGKEKDSEKLATYCEKIYSETVAVMDKVGDNRKKVVYCQGENGTSVIAKNSYQAELLNLVSDNVATVDSPTSKGSGNEVDLEQLMVWNPEIIIFNTDSIFDTVSTNSQWSNLDAIKNNQYYEVPFGPYNWTGNPPSVQRLLGMMWFTQLLYPEESTLDLNEEVKNYYKMFYHCDLTDEQYDKLVGNSINRS